MKVIKLFSTKHGAVIHLTNEEEEKATEIGNLKWNSNKNQIDKRL